MGQTYEGTLRQIVTDDKGTSLLIVFGLPPWSHENDAVFALRAALEMRKLFESLFSDWAIAVTSGACSGAAGPASTDETSPNGRAAPHTPRSLLALPGMLFTGIIGGRTRADHTIMGDVVNSAARYGATHAAVPCEQRRVRVLISNRRLPRPAVAPG